MSYKKLNEHLTNATRSLDDASSLIRDLDFEPSKNIRKIGELLLQIFEMQNRIYLMEPDLKPDFLKEK